MQKSSYKQYRSKLNLIRSVSEECWSKWLEARALRKTLDVTVWHDHSGPGGPGLHLFYCKSYIGKGRNPYRTHPMIFLSLGGLISSHSLNAWYTVGDQSSNKAEGDRESRAWNQSDTIVNVSRSTILYCLSIYSSCWSVREPIPHNHENVHYDSAEHTLLCQHSLVVWLVTVRLETPFCFWQWSGSSLRQNFTFVLSANHHAYKLNASVASVPPSAVHTYLSLKQVVGGKKLDVTTWHNHSGPGWPSQASPFWLPQPDSFIRKGRNLYRTHPMIVLWGQLHHTLQTLNMYTVGDQSRGWSPSRNLTIKYNQSDTIASTNIGTMPVIDPPPPPPILYCLI